MSTDKTSKKKPFLIFLDDRIINLPTVCCDYAVTKSVCEKENGICSLNSVKDIDGVPN